MSDVQKKSWLICSGITVLAGLVGGFAGSVVGLIPGFIAFRMSPGGYFGFFIDSFLLIETFCAVVGAVIVSSVYSYGLLKSSRGGRVLLAFMSLTIPAAVWLWLSASAGMNSFRIGGWLVGLLLGCVSLVLLLIEFKSIDPATE